MVKDINKTRELNAQLPNSNFKVDETSHSKFIGLLKNHSFSDLQGLNWLNEKLKENASIQAYSFESTMVSYQGHNIFSLF